MDIKKIEAIVAIFERSSLCRLTCREKESEITLERARAAGPGAAPPPADASVGAGGSDGGAENTVTVRAPVVGTLYFARDPESPPLAPAGAAVKRGGALCLIEAMKMYSEIESPCDGVVREVLFANGELAEYDRPLFVIERAKTG